MYFNRSPSLKIKLLKIIGTLMYFEIRIEIYDFRICTHFCPNPILKLHILFNFIVQSIVLYYET